MKAHAALFQAVGKKLRALRDERGHSQRALAEKAGLSLRFLADVESGHGNISIGRLADLAAALEVPLRELFPDESSTSGRDRIIALLGLRGAGKSTIGRALAKKLRCDFVELDEEIEKRAGMRLAEIFELHGEQHYRRLERDVLRELVQKPRALVIATGGGIVTDPETFALLRASTRTIWLRAKAEDHWSRVIAQGDARPMADRPRAMTELRAILDVRGTLYAQADQTIDTSGRPVAAIVQTVATA